MLFLFDSTTLPQDERDGVRDVAGSQRAAPCPYAPPLYAHTRTP